MLPKRFAYVQYIDVHVKSLLMLQLMMIENTDKDLPSLNCRSLSSVPYSE